MSFLSRFKKRKAAKAQSGDVMHSKLLIDVLTQYADYEQRGLICVAPLQHRVTVAQHLAALFTKNVDVMQSFFRGLALYATYEFTRLTTSQTLARLELEAKQAKREQLGRELTDEEAAVARMQAYADSDVTEVINRDLYFDIVVVSPNQEPVVISRVKDGKVDVLSVKE